LYFTDPDTTSKLDNPAGGIPDRVAASFATAQKSLDLAVYEFDLTGLSDALIAAAQRGVRVRLVTDTDSIGEQPIKDLIAAGVPVVDDQRSAIMHDKFVVIDGAIVWTGSMNFTKNDAYKNNNNFMEIVSTRLAQNYTAEFEEMFTQREFGPGPSAPTPNATLTINGTVIENYFSPDDGVAAHVLDVLDSARSSVYFMAFSFTRTDFADALVQRAASGVTVQGVFETRQIAAGGDAAWKVLTAAGLDVRQDGNPYVLHSKVFVIDKQIVVMGSYNFSRSAEDSNDENVLIIHNPEIATAYYAEWQKVWEKAGR
jgi:phosphatidylserine/phosphatidylglycerophosphate/cardiolipin synthase-like enzyme